MSEEKRWQKEVFRVLDVSKCMMQERRKREREKCGKGKKRMMYVDEEKKEQCKRSSKIGFKEGIRCWKEFRQLDKREEI
jgi:hypothetical protein